jgi:glyoxylase-like metal-dependent hydrolase (beta-lactamase superfamily II)
MSKSMRWIAAILIAAVAAYYWFFVESHLPSGVYSIDLAEVRKLANSFPGPKPQSIHVERVATFEFPQALVMAGASWKSGTGPAASYQIVYPDRTVIVDTGMDERITKALGRATFHAEPYQNMIRGMASASLILITHEHPDHIGGIASYPDPSHLVPAVRLTREQVNHPEQMDPAKLPAVSFQVLDYDRYFSPAPGIVLIKSPGHSPGSQMVFIQRGDGVEFLLLGDVAWQIGNVERGRERPRVVTTFILHEDREAVLRELAELHRLHAAEPNLHMLAGHEDVAIDALEKQSLLVEGFVH